MEEDELDLETAFKVVAIMQTITEDLDESGKRAWRKMLGISHVDKETTLTKGDLTIIMSGPKTRPTDVKVEDFLNAVEHPTRKEDGFELLQIMKEVTKKQPVMWGPSIVGFGSYHYKYESGREGDMPLTGFSPRKQNLTVYIMPGFDEYEDLLSRLGKHKVGKSCLYINKLADVDISVLRELIAKSVEKMDKDQTR